jgi:hypothetical protein
MPKLTEGLKKPDWSKYAKRSEVGVRKRAASRSLAYPRRKQHFARVTEDMFAPLIRLYGPSLGMHLALVMRASLPGTRRNGGWIVLPAVILTAIGANRQARARIVKRLVVQRVIVTRQASPGAALEYRLCPVEQWCVPDRISGSEPDGPE